MRIGPAFVLTYLRRRGLSGLFRMVIFPWVGLATTPLRWIGALLGSGPVFGARRRFFPHFHPVMAMTSVFYWNAQENIRRFGRSGISSLTGVGRSSLSYGFHYCRASLALYRRAGALTLVVGMGAWVLSHGLWAGSVRPGLVWAVLALLIASPAVYAQTFAMQTYHVMGWAFLPMGFYGLLENRPWIAAAAWLASSFFSTTAAALGGFFCLAAALGGDGQAGLAFVPALAKLASHGLILLRAGQGGGVLSNTARWIGLSRKGVKYHRPRIEGTDLDVYSLGAAALFLAWALILGGPFPWLPALAMGLLFANQWGTRFADPQSGHILLLSAVAAWTLHARQPWLLVPLALLLAPPPALLPFRHRGWSLRVPPARPFDLGQVLEGARKFLAPVPDGSRLFISFPDPAGAYARLFGGQRILMEPLIHEAGARDILVMPNWGMIAEYNRPGQTGFWGDSPAEVRKNLKAWKAGYAVIPSAGGEWDAGPWKRAGFRPLGRLDWTSVKGAWEFLKPADDAARERTVWRLFRAPGGGER